MINPFNVTITQVNRRGEWIARSHASCEDLDAAKARIETAIAFYRSRGYGITYRITHRNAEVMSGVASAA